MWGKKKRPDPKLVELRDDIAEARALRQEARTDRIAVRKQAPFVQMITDAVIDRQGRNHYIETLYQHLPKEAS